MVRTLFVLAALAGTLFSCRPPAPVEGEPAPALTLYGVHLQYFQGTKLTSTGLSREVTYQRASGGVLAHQALLGISRKTGGELFVKANQVEGNLPHRQAEGEDGVEAETIGMSGRTERAHYDGEAQRVTGSAPVTVNGAGYSVDARSFVLELHNEEYRFDGDIHSHMGGMP